jgi:hypothetical protein
LQVSEIPTDGSGGDDFLPRDPFEAGSTPSESPLFYSERDISQNFDQTFNLVQTFDQDIVQEIAMFREGYTDYDAAAEFYGLTPRPNISQDDYTTDLGSNISVIELNTNPNQDNQLNSNNYAGWVTIEMDFVQNFDQDIVQDVFYEMELIDLELEGLLINQTYTADVLVTETRTRLVGE